MRLTTIFLLILTLLNINIFAQSLENKNTFPDSWLGNYNGKMYILRAQSVVIDSLDVEFQFLKTDVKNRWTYRMKYHSKKYGDILKDYELIKPDSLAKNSYLIDEKEGILILNTLMGNTLYSNFIVSGSLMSCMLRKESNDLYFEIFTSKDQCSLSIQSKAKKMEDSYIVDSYPPFTTQFVRFVKINSLDKHK